MNCFVCGNKIWFFQREIRRLIGPDDIGEYYGRHLHRKCNKKL